MKTSKALALTTFLPEKIFQVLKIEDDNGAVAFEREQIGAGIDQVSLPAN